MSQAATALNLSTATQERLAAEHERRVVEQSALVRAVRSFFADEPPPLGSESETESDSEAEMGLAAPASLPRQPDASVQVGDGRISVVFKEHGPLGLRLTPNEPTACAELLALNRGTQAQTFGQVLRPGLFLEAVAGPLLRSFKDHMGPLVLEIPPSRNPIESARFENALEGFLGQLPSELQIGVELRNRQLLRPRYLDLLRAHRAIHVLNFWTLMPTVGAQLELPGILTGPAAVCRVLLPPRTKYADRKRDLSPFDSLQDPQPQMRADILKLLRKTEHLQGPTYVLVNNKAEGCAPLSIRALAEFICGAGIAT